MRAFEIFTAFGIFVLFAYAFAIQLIPGFPVVNLKVAGGVVVGYFVLLITGGWHYLGQRLRLSTRSILKIVSGIF